MPALVSSVCTKPGRKGGATPLPTATSLHFGPDPGISLLAEPQTRSVQDPLGGSSPGCHLAGAHSWGSDQESGDSSLMTRRTQLGIHLVVGGGKEERSLWERGAVNTQACACRGLGWTPCCRLMLGTADRGERAIRSRRDCRSTRSLRRQS